MNAPCPSEIWPGVAREDVEAEERDEVDGDVGGLLRLEVAERERREDDRDEPSAANASDGAGDGAHTFSPAVRPKSRRAAGAARRG